LLFAKYIIRFVKSRMKRWAVLVVRDRIYAFDENPRKK
jgi:hypothetical protein